MLYNYIKTAIRNFTRNSMFTLINLLGLAVGLTASILILLYVYNELNFDTFHEKADEIYRMNIVFNQQDVENVTAMSTAAMGVSLREEVPEVRDMVRISNKRDAYLRYNDRNYYVDNLRYADSTFFRMFNFKLLKGNPETALKNPFSILLTEEEAGKIFKDKNPIGQFVRYNNEHSMKVTGIVETPPPNSQLQFNALVSFSTLYEYDKVYLDWDGGYGYYTYVEFIPGFDPSVLKERLEPFMHKHINYKYREVGVEISMQFEPLRHIHLYSKANADLDTKGNLTNIYTFSAIAIFILLIACINFMNLSTARSSKRAREVGVRKVMGASRSRLRGQFLTESLLISLLAMILALILVELVQPVFSNLVGQELNLYSRANLPLLGGIVLLVIIVGLISGSYPAFYLSSFRPVTVLKGGWMSTGSKTWFRDILVTFQFAITIALIICTLIIYRQIGFMKSKELGFEKENVVYAALESKNARTKVPLLKTEIENLAAVKSVAASSAVPGFGLNRNGYLPEGYEEPMMFHVMDVDEELLHTLDIKIIEGKGFSNETKADDNNYLVNKALVQKLGWDNPVGKTITRNGVHKIIGVVENFHFAPLHEQINPMLITNIPFNGYDYLVIRLGKGNPQNILKQIERKWSSILPTETFAYHFLDRSLDRIYNQEKRFGRLFIYFSLLAILIACLGLLGLASYMVEQRSREIGIRKVFGSSETAIVRLFSWEFSKRVLIANIIAWPVAWYLMSKWLENFAYRISMGWWIFLLAGFIAFLLALLTVSYQSLKAANMNPVDVVKYE
ncbi:MAG: ABC transporter permease [Bacteroidales bacterium]|nr:ABC transporter permease [Bacteroidales bacterium]MCF8344225.1 ABC transporter permease [Bacteroidales bacterium]MCF8350957.1 ABC transporter permease [Bacteroidales bacterium]MCF8376544.1 ABC transporter permease [Bacteroidales bacterium]MCF8400604.1 ABC transporter permease [Bacteroidales bacterium]